MVCFPRFPGKPRVKPVDEAWKDCHGQSVGDDEQCQPRQAQTDDGISQMRRFNLTIRPLYTYGWLAFLCR